MVCYRYYNAIIILLIFLNFASSAPGIKHKNSTNTRWKNISRPLQPVRVFKSKCRMTEGLPDPNSKCCGVDSAMTSYIVGGNKTGLRQYPWLALIEYRTHHGIVTGCGGSLISGRYVLTAAHCVVASSPEDDVPVSVRLGEYDKRTDPDCIDTDHHGRECAPRKISIDIENIKFHELYNRKFLNDDIAIIRLKKLAPYTDFIRPICMPNSDITENTPNNLRFSAAGWGVKKQTKRRNGSIQPSTSYVKRHVDLPFVAYEECAKKNKYARILDGQDTSKICAGGEKDKSTCYGDSGGPLMYNKDGKYNLAGVHPEYTRRKDQLNKWLSHMWNLKD